MIAGPALSHLLPSQRALLERFRYLTEYGDHLLVLHGGAGVGKTVLAQSLLESAEAFNQAYVCAEARMDPAQLRERIVRQWRPASVFDPHEPLLDTLERVMPDASGRLMLIVDDAHRMADTLLAEVIALMMEQEAVGLRLTLVLVSDEQLVNRLQEQLPEAYRHRLIPVEVPLLSVRERRKLYDQLVRRYSGKLFLNDSAVERQLADQDGSAKAVVALVEAAKSRPPLKETLPDKRWLLAGTMALLLTAGAWGLWPQSVDTELDEAEVVAPAMTPPQAADAVPEAAAEADSGLPEDDLGLAKPWNERETVLAVPTDDTMPTVPQDEAQVADLNAAIAAPVVEVVAESDAPVDSPAPSVPLAAQDGAEPVALTPQPVPEPQAEPEPELPLPLAARPLSARPADSYLLQLAVFSYPQLIGPFLESHGLKEGIRVYRIDREPQAWYVLVQGGFADKRAALAAKEALVASVRRLSPYVKSLETVQKELTEELELAEILSQQR